VDTNVAIATVACELARQGAFGTLIHFSSSEVYGSAEYVPMDEDHPLRPQTPYAASKAAGDHIVLSYGHTFGIDASIVRPFNTIGPRQNERAYAGVIPLFTRQALTGQPITIDGDGEQTRDFVYVEHVAAGAVRAYEEDDTRGRVVNVATGHETSINCLAVGILELTHSTAPVHHGPPRPGDVRRHCGSTALMSTLLGLDTRTPLERSLGTTIEWYRSQLGRDD
jgi:UDP-glucose 4-epimerase